MARFKFVKAERTQVHVLFGLMGVTGSGKSETALKLATGLCSENEIPLHEKIAVLDTENRIRMFARKYKFSVLERNDNFTVDFFTDVIKYLRDDMPNVEVLVIDSLTHMYESSGGMLDLAGGVFENWGRKVSPVFKKFKEAMLSADFHIISTMRVNTDYAEEEYVNGRGEMKTKKVAIGEKPIMKKEFAYEFLFSAVLDQDHTLRINKNALDGLSKNEYLAEEVTIELGRELRAWSLEGKTASDLLDETITKLALDYGVDKSALINRINAYISRHANFTSPSVDKLTNYEASYFMANVIPILEKKLKEEKSNASQPTSPIKKLINDLESDLDKMTDEAIADIKKSTQTHNGDNHG